MRRKILTFVRIYRIAMILNKKHGYLIQWLIGVGDLIVTCTSMHSRNLHAGMLIGRGKDVETAKKEVGQVVEGINALPAACKLAKKYKVEMPIVNAVDDILSGRLAARDALATMMGRQLKQE